MHAPQGAVAVAQQLVNHSPADGYTALQWRFFATGRNVRNSRERL